MFNTKTDNTDHRLRLNKEDKIEVQNLNEKYCEDRETQ